MRGEKQEKLWKLKVAWMVEHRALWEHVVLRGERFVRAPEALYMTDRATWRAIANGLKDAGFISRTTGTIDVPVRKLIAAASTTSE